MSMKLFRIDARLMTDSFITQSQSYSQYYFTVNKKISFTSIKQKHSGYNLISAPKVCANFKHCTLVKINME